MLCRIGNVSGEGGPLLLADLQQIQAWSGVEGTDYARACAVFDSVPEPPGGVLVVEGRPAIVWEMGGAGTADVFDKGEGLLVVRAWVDDVADIARLAALPMLDATIIGRIAPIDALLILWAPEDGRAIVASSRMPGANLAGLAIDGSALVTGRDSGQFLVKHDKVDLASGASARRLALCGAP